MLDAIIGFILGVFVTVIAVRILAKWAIKRFERELDSVLADIEKSKTPLTIKARVEEINGVFYFYNNENGEFLVQGRDLQELLKHSESRWPGATVQVVGGDEETIAHLKALAQ